MANRRPSVDEVFGALADLPCRGREKQFYQISAPLPRKRCVVAVWRSDWLRSAASLWLSDLVSLMSDEIKGRYGNGSIENCSLDLSIDRTMKSFQSNHNLMIESNHHNSGVGGRGNGSAGGGAGGGSGGRRRGFFSYFLGSNSHDEVDSNGGDGSGDDDDEYEASGCCCLCLKQMYFSNEEKKQNQMKLKRLLLIPLSHDLLTTILLPFPLSLTPLLSPQTNPNPKHKISSYFKSLNRGDGIPIIQHAP